MRLRTVVFRLDEEHIDKHESTARLRWDEIFSSESTVHEFRTCICGRAFFVV